MPSDLTTGRTAPRGDSRANTITRAAVIRPGCAPPEDKPRFSWGIRRADKPKKKGRKSVEREAAPAPARYSTTFTAKPRGLTDERDSVTRLSARVTPNALTMYSAGEYAKRDVAGRGMPEAAGGGHASDESFKPGAAGGGYASDESFRPGAAGGGHASDESFKPLRFGERMLRNTAVCVAALLCALAIRTVDAPIARTVSAGLRDWVTMDLDESLGSLKFVQNLLPDAALVFWHIGSSQTFARPSQAALSHGWNENEPYLTYSSDTQNPVYASAAGEVAAITYLEDGSSTVRLRHEDGMETVYGNLASCVVREGDLAAVGDVIGASGTLFFEIRGEGRSMNPAPLMAERQP